MSSRAECGRREEGSIGFEFARGMWEKVRVEYGFSSLMKQNKKGKNCAVFCFAGFFFLNFLCYEVFAKQKKKKCADNYYWCG